MFISRRRYDEAIAVRPDRSLAGERRDAAYQRPEDVDRYVEGLRKARLPA